MTNPDNLGLEVPIEAFIPIVLKYATAQRGLSRADIWALAGLTGAEISQSRSPILNFPLQFIGRIDRDDNERKQTPCMDEHNEIVPCTYNRGPHRSMPSPDDAITRFKHTRIITFLCDTIWIQSTTNRNSHGCTYNRCCITNKFWF